MQLLAATAVAALIGASLAVACRLLALQRRTGGLPELLLGGMLLLSVGVGYPLRIAADRMDPPWAGAFFAVSALGIGLGFSLLFVFTWRVFRPHDRWACVFAAAGVATALGKALHGCIQAYSRGAVQVMDESAAAILLQSGPIFVAYLWTAWESLRCYGMMRRRARLGLADAAVSDRFLLWALMALSAAGGVSITTVALALRVNTFHSPAVLLASSLTGLAQAALLVLAFAPPRAYLRWVRARRAAAGV